MSGYIAIESKFVSDVDLMGFGASHLYLVFVPIDTTPDDWLIIRSGPTVDSVFGPWGLLAGQVNILLMDSKDAYPEVDPWGDERGAQGLDITGDIDLAWVSMSTIANSILAESYTYNGFAREVGGFSEAEVHYWVALNSNSFITSILYHSGLDPAANMPTNLGTQVGFETLLDIAGGHTLSVGDYFSDVFAGGGADTVNGNGGQNYLFGGDGNDILNGGDGDDILSGGKNMDTLNGGAGNDILFGNNSGADTLRGGEGADKMYGSAGVDTFDYDAVSDSPYFQGILADRIYGFAIRHSPSSAAAPLLA